MRSMHIRVQLPVAFPVDTLCCVVRGGRGQAHAVAQFAHACRRDYHRAFGRRGDPPALLARCVLRYVYGALSY